MGCLLVGVGYLRCLVILSWCFGLILRFVLLLELGVYGCFDLCWLIVGFGCFVVLLIVVCRLFGLVV